MRKEQVCPFLGRDGDFCDVGEGYISTHDVQMMVSYCNSRFEECSTYRELIGRFPDEVAATPPAESTETGRATASRGRARKSEVRSLSSRRSPRSNQPKKETIMARPSNRKGWVVALAGTGINLALGILYSWSIFKEAIADSIKAGGPFDWDPASTNDPYAVACLVFAAAMILAGKVQDKFGPRITCVLGGLLVGGGFFWTSRSTSYWAWVLGFGVLAGTGIGFGYSAAIPSALKWFPPARTGLIAGIVVSGFSLASLYIAPLATYLLGACGLQQSMLFFGVAFAVVVGLLGLLVANPPQGYVPAVVSAPQAEKDSPASSRVVDRTPSELFRDGKFYTLWTCYFIGAGAGLMVIGSARGLARVSMGEMAFLVVAVMAIGNTAGRLVAGVISDKIGRAATLTIMLVFQATLMFAAIPVLAGEGANPMLVVLLVSIMVFNYGTNLSLFPSFAKDLWGMKNFGMNYGILFSAWGAGAFVLVRVAEMVKVKTGGFTANFAAAGVLLLIGAMLSLSLRPSPFEVAEVAPATDALEAPELELQRAGAE